MRSPRLLSLSSLRTVPLSERKKDCDKRDFGAPYRGAARDLFYLRGSGGILLPLLFVAVLDVLGGDFDAI
ncbi:MAG: hypothetical protein Q9M14_03970 [Mariprofundaceae bacterium]|nr:hypothetical protein [Mariprofundaceae bacterium]